MLPTIIRNLPMVIPQQNQDLASGDDEARLARLIQEAAKLDVAIKEVEEFSQEAYIFFRRNDTFVELEQVLSDYISEYTTLQNELDDKRSEKYKSEPPPKKSPEELDNDPEEKRQPTRNEKSILERLYRKICLKTHPDKTNNKELHKLFHMGTTLYQNGDIQGLEELLDLISAASGKVASARNKARSYIKKKIEEYQHIVKVKHNQLQFSKMSPGYQLYQIKRSNEDSPQYAMYIANEGLRANIVKIKQAIFQLKNEIMFS